MTAKRLSLVAFLVTAAASLLVPFAPLGQTTEGSGAPGAVVRETTRSTNLLSSEGPWILILVAVPLVVAGVPLLVPRRPVRVAAAVFLWAACLISLASIGVFFVPAAILLTVAAFARDEHPAALPGGRHPDAGASG